MKALTIWQPWATLIALGLKQYETRSWKTSHRGTLAIHAAKRWRSEQKEVAQSSPLPVVFEHVGYDTPADLPRGKVVGVVNVKAVTRTERLRDHIQEFEESLGDYSPERFGWRLSDPRRLEDPIPVRGHQRLWTLPEKIAQKIAITLNEPIRYA